MLQAVYAFWQYDLCDVFIEVSKPAFSAAEGAAQPPLNAHAAREALWLSLDAGLRRDFGVCSYEPTAQEHAHVAQGAAACIPVVLPAQRGLFITACVLCPGYSTPSCRS